LAHEAIVYEQRDGGATWVFRRGMSDTPVTVSGRLRVSAGEGVRTAVLAGLGLAVASEWLFGPELESGEVVAVLQDWLLPSADLWAVFPAGRQASVKARAFASFVQLRVPNWGANGWPGNASLCSSRLPIVSAWIDNKSAGSVKHDVLSAAA